MNTQEILQQLETFSLNWLKGARTGPFRGRAFGSFWPLRLTRIYNPQSTVAQALQAVEAWLESPTLHVLFEGDSFFPTAQSVIGKSKVTGGAIHDARIAAICIRHGVVRLLTADREDRQRVLLGKGLS